MPFSRRTFLKSSMIAAGEAALPGLPAMAATVPVPAPATAGDAAVDGAGRGVGVAAGEFTRGLGVYPGVAAEVFSPGMKVDATTYRNLALRRPAKHSSSYDYNLTAQLVTDGIKETRLPRWVAVSTSANGVLSKQDREIVLDHFPPVGENLSGAKVSVEVQVAGGERAPVVDRVRAFVALPDYLAVKDLRVSVSVSEDARVWEEVGAANALEAISAENYPPDLVRGRNLFYPSVELSRTCESRIYRVTCERLNHPDDTQTIPWMFGQVEFYRGDARVEIGGPYEFTSAWMSAGSGEEWVSVDLGARCAIDRVGLYWIARAAEGKVQVSDDEVRWTDVHRLGAGSGQVDEIRLAAPVHARFVRVLMTRPTSQYGYILSEMEVWGRGGLVAVAAQAAAMGSDGRLQLAGDAWRVERSSAVAGDGAAISRVGFRDASWVVATVPGTVLTSYFNAGVIADPNFGQNQLYISDSYFCSDFWYRTEFDAPAVKGGDIVWLDFAGINWKAQIFLNGELLGRIDGGFMRGRFDVTGKLRVGEKNALAVLIEKNATPGSTKQKTLETPGRNGGALGADNPTYHASIGWDWIPTIRGRNTGIWGAVTLATTGAVTLDEPLVSASLPLPDTSTADISVAVNLVNHRAIAMTGTLHFKFGAVEVTQQVSVPSNATTVAKFDPSAYAALQMKEPQLWWPVGYGDPH
ncbi:MAG: discoidin domain-containing protein, partial [Acidobacteriaceae bacterium]